MSEIVRTSLEKSLKKSKKEAKLILEVDDEQELLRIIEQDAYSDWEDLKKKHNLK